MKLDDLQEALNDSAIFKDMFKGLADVISAANEFPKCKDSLYDAMLAHPNHFIKSFADVYEIAKFFMQDGQRKQLLVWLIQLGDDEFTSMLSPLPSFHILKSLINYFDSGADRERLVIRLFSYPQINDVIDGYFKAYARFSSVETVIRDIGMICCPSSNVVKETVMKSLLLCPDNLFLSLITNISELSKTIKLLSPLSGENLCLRVINSSQLSDRYVRTISDYLWLVNFLPEKLKQEILEKSYIENNFLGKKIETFDDLMFAIMGVPVSLQEKLINKFLDEGSLFVKYLINGDNLINCINIIPVNLQEKVIRKFLKDVENMKGVSLTVSDCIELANFFSGEIKKKLIDIIPMDYKQILAISDSNMLRQLHIDLNFVERLLEKYVSSRLSDSPLTYDIPSLILIANLFPNIKNILEKEIKAWPLINSCMYFSPAQSDRICINDSLSNFRKSYPTVNLVSQLQSNEIKSLVSSLVDFDKFFKRAEASEKESFIDFIMRLDENEFISTIKNVSRFMAILEIFPSHTIKLIEKVLNNEKIQAALIKNDLDISTLLFKFPKASSLIESWMSSSEYAKEISEFNALILSVQKPHNAHLAGVQSGKSGIILQQVNNAGYIYLHRDKKLSVDDGVIVSKHLKPNGWLIVTGHGGMEGEELSGGYLVSTNVSVDITLAPSELCEMILSSHCLKAGDHINIVLYCCYAGYGEQSYASQLMEALKNCGINSNIIACTGRVGRMGGYSIDDIPEKFIKFRAYGEILLFSNDRQMMLDDMYFSSAKIHIANNGHFNEEATSYFLTMLKSEILKLNLHENLEMVDSKLLNHLTVENYNLSYMDAKRISKEKNCVIIHKANDSRNIGVMLPSGQAFEVPHEYVDPDNFLSNKLAGVLRYLFASTYPITYHIKRELNELVVKPGYVDIGHFEMDLNQTYNFLKENSNAIIIRKSSMAGYCAISYCKVNEPFEVMHGRFLIPKIFIEDGKVRLNHPENIGFCDLLKTTLPKINDSISKNNKQEIAKDSSSSSSQVGLFSSSSAASQQGDTQAVEAKNDDLPSTKPQ